jgi:hypothetical protein
MHLSVSHATAAIAARRIHYDLSGHLPGYRIKLHGTLFQLKRSADGVEHITQSKFHAGMCRIKLQNGILRGSCRCHGDYRCEK